MASKRACTRDQGASSSQVKCPKTRGGLSSTNRRHNQCDNDYTMINIPLPPELEPAAPQLHKWLHFESDKHQSRLSLLVTKKFGRSISIDWPSMEALGVSTQLKSYLVHTKEDGQLSSKAWLRLFDIREPVYKELCYEFYATFYFDTQCDDYDWDNMISFHLGGKDHNMSLRTFATTMGLYTQEEVLNDDFTNAMIDAGIDFSKDILWREIAEGVYDPHNSRATAFTDPVHRILHRTIAESILGRGNSGGVSVRDLEIMSILLDPKTTCNVAYLLAESFNMTTRTRASGYICGGSYVTRLAKRLGILTNEEVKGLTSVENKHTATLDTTSLRSMKMIDHIGPDRRAVLGQPPTDLRSLPSIPIKVHTSEVPSVDTTSAHTDANSLSTPTTATPIIATTDTDTHMTGTLHPDSQPPPTSPLRADPSASTRIEVPSFDFGLLLTDPVASYALLSEVLSLRQGISALLAAGGHPPLPPPAYHLRPPPTTYTANSHTMSSPPPPETSTHGSTSLPAMEDCGEAHTSNPARETVVDSHCTSTDIDRALAADTLLELHDLVESFKG